MSDSRAPFFSPKSTQNSTCPESHIIPCQKWNDIVSHFPFLSEEMVSIPHGTTKLRTAHGGARVECWQVVVLVAGPGDGGGGAAAGSSLEIYCSEYCCCEQENLQVSNDAVGLENPDDVGKHYLRYPGSWIPVDLLLDTDQLGKYPVGWTLPRLEFELEEVALWAGGGGLFMEVNAEAAAPVD